MTGESVGLRSWLARLLPFLGWGLAILLLLLAWRQIFSDPQVWQDLNGRVNLGQMLIGTVVLAVAQALRSQVVYVSHRLLGYPITRWDAYQTWFLSQIGKYLPGGIGAFAARAVLDQRIGMPLTLATASALWEMMSIVFTGLLFGLGSGLTLNDGVYVLPLIVTLLAMLAGGYASQSYWPWRTLFRLGLKPAGRMLEALDTLSGRQRELFVKLSAYAAASWLVIGLGFFFVLRSYDSQTTFDFIFATVTYALSWSAGFLVFFAPGGLGPREIVLTALLTPHFGLISAASLSLLGRVWWTAGEGINMLVAAGAFLWARQQSRSGDLPGE